jgi:hypothetical protein
MTARAVLSSNTGGSLVISTKGHPQTQGGDDWVVPATGKSRGRQGRIPDLGGKG